MSYSVSLVDKSGDPVIVERHQTGGTVAVGGSTKATCSITFNYSEFYYGELDEDDGLRWLDGKTAEETADRLRDAVDALGTEESGDYWDATPGNAGSDLAALVEWAEEHPEATWRVA